MRVPLKLPLTPAQTPEQFTSEALLSDNPIIQQLAQIILSLDEACVDASSEALDVPCLVDLYWHS